MGRRWWITYGILAAAVIPVILLILPLSSDPLVPEWRKERWAARNLAETDRPAGIRALEALMRKAQAESNREAEFEALEELAAYYRLEERTADALAAYRALVAFPAFEPMPGDLKGGRLGYKGWIANLSCQKGPYDEGIATYRHMIATTLAGETHPQYPMHTLYADLARCLVSAGRPEEGIAALREDVAWHTTNARSTSRQELFRSHVFLARTLADIGRQEEARATFLKLLAIFEKRGEKYRPNPEAGQQPEVMERELISLIDDLARRQVFAEPRDPR